MTPQLARSLHAAERRALAGENESQDSQEILLFLIQQHGLGVVSGGEVHSTQQQPMNSSLAS
jgi:hypothetical protein